MITGTSAGGGAYSPALTDFVVMVEGSRLFLTGPGVVEEVMGESVSMDSAARGFTRGTASATWSHPMSTAAELVRELLGHLRRASRCRRTRSSRGAPGPRSGDHRPR